MRKINFNNFLIKSGKTNRNAFYVIPSITIRFDLHTIQFNWINLWFNIQYVTK